MGARCLAAKAIPEVIPPPEMGTYHMHQMLDTGHYCSYQDYVEVGHLAEQFKSYCALEQTVLFTSHI